MCRERGGNKGHFERGVRELGFVWGLKDRETETERDYVHKTYWFSHFNIYKIICGIR